MLKNYSLNRLLALAATFGFAFLLLDTTIEHWSILTKDAMTFVPLIFSVAGIIIGIVAVMRWNEKWIRVLHIFLFVSFLVAGTGVYFHVHEDDDEKAGTAVQTPEEKEKDKPLLAPLAFGGIACIGLMGTARKWKSEVI